MSEEKELFKGLTVLELASVLAGPAVGLFFAELGARVIKIENARAGGDVTRSWLLRGEQVEEGGVSAYYASVNWNKETHFLDTAQAAGRDFIYALLPQVDIVVANFKPSSARRMGLDAESLRAVAPRLIYANICGFEPNAEGLERVAFDVVLQAETGFMYMNGQADNPPTKMPVALIDVLAAHQLKEAILCALYRRERTGQGATVEVSLYASALAALSNQASGYLMRERVPQRIGSLHPNIAPYGELIEAKDGTQYVLAAGNQAQFAALVDILGRAELATDARFADNARRVENRLALINILQEAFLLLPSHQAFYTECQRRQVPIGRVRDLQAIFGEESAQKLILSQTEADGSISKRVQTAVFRIN